MTKDKLFTNEQLLLSGSDNAISRFWRQGTFSEFVGKDQLRINFCQFSFAQFEKTVVIVPGRVESYLKYKELAYEFHQQQFNVFILDHRGQGLSGRMLPNPHKGYVESFDDYVADLNYFVEHYVVSEHQHKPYILAHSMGGAIACRFMQTYPDKVQAAVLSSPMIAINSGLIPHNIANGAVKFLDKVNRMFSKTRWYFLGQGNYKATPFKRNHLMQSQVRYQQFLDLYRQIPSLQLGGVTIKWLIEAEKVRLKIFNNLAKLTTPIMVLQGSEDVIVDNNAQDDFCQQLHQQNANSCPKGEPTVIHGGQHEILFEKDVLRQHALRQVFKWFNKH
ncbi:alpha/beta fold hydrolase [Thalassotalea sp. PLHSN55]|uniref:alpha/beta fold hydrolase n=1 Tax=Thalassotalea sp. PLHSN55 TaxID=3435888 RepID=UPI003F85C9B7